MTTHYQKVYEGLGTDKSSSHSSYMMQAQDSGRLDTKRTDPFAKIEEDDSDSIK